MNELKRMTYLEALGIDSYVSRRQLPGAALTRRLAMVPSRPVAPAGKTEVKGAPPIPTLEEVSSPAGSRRARIDSAEPSSPAQQAASHQESSVPRFSLTAIVAGNWLWLEELGDMPLTTEQVRLVQSMARAMSLSLGQGESVAAAGGRPEVTQFDWPIHTNHQLDLGEEAARAGVAGFVGRKLEQYGCGGLVLLGQSCARHVPVQEMKIPVVSTASSAEILAGPALKPQVWQDLRPLVNKP